MFDQNQPYQTSHLTEDCNNHPSFDLRQLAYNPETDTGISHHYSHMESWIFPSLWHKTGYTNRETETESEKGFILAKISHDGFPQPFKALGFQL